MTRILVVVVLVCLPPIAFGETLHGRLTRQLIDIPDATVVTAGPAGYRTAITDSKGRFVIPGLPKQSLNLFVILDDGSVLRTRFSLARTSHFEFVIADGLTARPLPGQIQSVARPHAVLRSDLLHPPRGLGLHDLLSYVAGMRVDSPAVPWNDPTFDFFYEPLIGDKSPVKRWPANQQERRGYRTGNSLHGRSMIGAPRGQWWRRALPIQPARMRR